MTYVTESGTRRINVDSGEVVTATFFALDARNVQNRLLWPILCSIQR